MNEMRFTSVSFPLNFWDISLFLAVISLISLITSEILSSYYRKTKIFIDRKKFKNVSYVISIAFVATVIIRIITIIFAQ
jgi:uncharacterized membrane protein